MQAAPMIIQRQMQVISKQKHVQRFQEGLVFKAHRLVRHSTLDSRVMKKKKSRICTSLLPPTLLPARFFARHALHHIIILLPLYVHRKTLRLMAQSKVNAQ